MLAMTVTQTGAVAVTLIVQGPVGDLPAAIALSAPKSNPVTMVLPMLVAAVTPTAPQPVLDRHAVIVRSALSWKPATMVLPTLVAAVTPTVRGPGRLRSVAMECCARRSKSVTTATRMPAGPAIRTAAR